MHNDFYAMLSRMKHIERWALMRNSSKENISEHSLEVAMLTHCLCLLGNKRLGQSYDTEHAVCIALYHDCTEIITGDMPTPIKYYNQNIRGVFGEIEHAAAERLLAMLPEDLREEYHDLFFISEADGGLQKLVKAADKLSALIKCIEEEKAGNSEFVHAKKSILQSIRKMSCPEAELFLADFLGGYGKTLDELNQE